jgi:hypothetical protein
MGNLPVTRHEGHGAGKAAGVYVPLHELVDSFQALARNAYLLGAGHRRAGRERAGRECREHRE